MQELTYHTLDLNFQGFSRSIASFAVPLKGGKWLLVESGPYSCHKTLVKELDKLGITLKDIEKVFVTHIHLDHSGGAWALAKAGSAIYSHPLGTPHLVEPGKLYESAQRIYGDKMETLWSKVGPIPTSQVHSVADGEIFRCQGRDGEIKITAHHTPGHAAHHIAWQMNDVLFAGDVCGVRINEKAVEIPAPPPEFHIEVWLQSLNKIRSLAADRGNRGVREIALTHFGGYRDIENLLRSVETRLQEITAWFRGQIKDKPVEEWKITPEEFTAFLKKRYIAQGMTEDEIKTICTTTPPDMTITGVIRYLKKFENPSPSNSSDV